MTVNNQRDNEGDSLRKAMITGRVCTGLGEAKYFTQLPWFKSQLVHKLGIDPYPGTLNLNLEDLEARRMVEQLRQSPGVEIVPEGTFCSGVCYRVVLNDEIQGVAVFPQVGGYPDDKLEIVCGVNLKQTLGIQDGDVISIVLNP